MSSNEKVRGLSRELILEAFNDGILFSDLITIMREEKEKIRKERIQDRIARSPEEMDFRKKAETFLEKAKRNMKCVTNFHTENFAEKYLEILCVYFTYGKCQEASDLRELTGDRLRLKPDFLFPYEGRLKEIALAYISPDAFHRRSNKEVISALVEYILKS